MICYNSERKFNKLTVGCVQKKYTEGLDFSCEFDISYDILMIYQEGHDERQ